MPAWNIQIVCARHEHDHTLAYLIIRKKQLKIVLMEELDAAIEYLQYALVRLLVPDSSCYQDMLPPIGFPYGWHNDVAGNIQHFGIRLCNPPVKAASARLLELTTQLETAIKKEGFSDAWQKAGSGKELKAVLIKT